MKKPYVVCHMGATIDGRIIGENWGQNLDRFGSVYEYCHNTFNADAWMVGRVTMEKDFTGGKKSELVKTSKLIKREAFIGNKEATTFAIAVDPHGKLGWDENEIDGDHVIEILPSRFPMSISNISRLRMYRTFLLDREILIFHLRLTSYMTCSE